PAGPGSTPVRGPRPALALAGDHGLGHVHLGARPVEPDPEGRGPVGGAHDDGPPGRLVQGRVIHPDPVARARAAQAGGEPGGQLEDHRLLPAGHGRPPRPSTTTLSWQRTAKSGPWFGRTTAYSPRWT